MERLIRYLGEPYFSPYAGRSDGPFPGHARHPLPFEPHTGPYRTRL